MNWLLLAVLLGSLNETDRIRTSGCWTFSRDLRLLGIWYCVAADYSYGAVSGTYPLSLNGEVSTLILNKDRSFQQELSRDGKVERTQGSWRRLGEGGVVFSKEFLKVSGHPMARPTAKLEKDLDCPPQ